ncbi:unnamed protein product [Protopolystoma xenopodis]|uniref:Uncharacterized protein n=1 Tax=Protopolystoma xenopodis TaxID=117903 RepID=A0A3S5CPL6_9PLAT|nr:unnamed protein product [Protopolystoma xenopodis]
MRMRLRCHAVSFDSFRLLLIGLLLPIDRFAAAITPLYCLSTLATSVVAEEQHKCCLFLAICPTLSPHLQSHWPIFA